MIPSFYILRKVIHDSGKFPKNIVMEELDFLMWTCHLENFILVFYMLNCFLNDLLENIRKIVYYNSVNKRLVIWLNYSKKYTIMLYTKWRGEKFADKS